MADVNALLVRGDVTEVEVDGCYSLFSPATGQVLTLNETASDVWRLVDGTSSTDDVVASLAAAYGRDPSEVRPPVLEVISQLRGAGMMAGLAADTDDEGRSVS